MIHVNPEQYSLKVKRVKLHRFVEVKRIKFIKHGNTLSMMMHKSLSLKIAILILTVLWLFSTIGCFMFDEIERNSHLSLSDLFIDLKELQCKTH